MFFDNSSSLKIGDIAPDFDLLDSENKIFKLSENLNSNWLIIYFYPKDNTTVCTKQACFFKESYVKFKSKNASIIGISSDTTESHKDFIQKLNLPFKLLSDKDDKVRKLYGIKNTMGLIPGRVTLVINSERIIKYIFSSQLDAEAHIKNTIEYIESTEKK